MVKFDVGIDIGTTNTKICFKNKPIIVNMPSVVAIKKNSKEVVGVGEKAYDMLGKAPNSIIVKKTMSKGVVGDFFLNQIMLKEAFLKNFGRNFKKPRICICFHSFMTNLEKLVFKNSIFSSNNDNIFLIDESLASGIGAGLNFSNENKFLVVNIGGGTTDIAIICSDGIVSNKSVRTGSELIDEIICKNLSRNHNLLIGKSTAEKIKKRAVTVLNPNPNLKFEIKGKDTVSGLPKTLKISQKEICSNINMPVEKIIDNIYDIITISSDVIADIQKNGIILTGGGSLVPGLKEVISKRFELPVTVAKNPISCAAFGALNSSSVLNESFNKFILQA